MLETLAGVDAWVTRRGQGAPMLMLHCSLANQELLKPLARKLESDHQITLMDLPGHGRSAVWTAAPPSVITLAVAQAKELITAPTHIVGHSLGGAIALRIAAEAPELVSRLTLIEPVFMSIANGPAAAVHNDDWAPFEAAFDAGDREAATRHFIDRWGTGSRWETLDERSRKAMVERVHIVRDTFPELSDDAGNVLPKLDRVTCPVSLIEGSRTEPIIGEVHEALSARLPNARRVIVSGAGHMVPLSHPKEIVAEIRS